MQYADIVHRCFRCGYCNFTSDFQDFNCPTYNKYRMLSYSPGGRMWLINAWLNKELQWREHFADIMYSCATCNNCVEECVQNKFNSYLSEIFIAARGEMVEQGLVPPTVRDYIKNIQLSGNPYRAPAEDRGKWSEGSGLTRFQNDEYLYYVGCVGSYDERGQKMALALGKLLIKAGLSVGILGSDEKCDGNEVRVLGESMLFEELARQNTDQFAQLGVKKVISLSPHAFNVMKKYYPDYGAGFDTLHYTQVLWELIKLKKLNPGQLEIRVTYHDPCYLGRHNGEYRAPRKVLQSIPGLSLVEMRRNRKDSFCCGGGGGNFFTDILGSGPDSPAAVRVKEAVATGAEVLAVACPNCAKMFEDAIKVEGLEDRLQVRDIAELVLESLKD